MRKLIKILKLLHFRFRDDEVPALGAQLAYYLILSFFPFLIFLLTLIGFSPIRREDILYPLSNLIPQEAYMLVEINVMQVVEARNGRLLSLGFVGTLWTASNGVGAIIRGLNKAYDFEETRPFWKVKIISLVFTITLAIAILLSMVLLIFGQQLGVILGDYLSMDVFVQRAWNYTRFGITLALMVFVFAALYHFMPNRKTLWREAVPGALFSTFGWIVISMGFAFYVNNFSVYSVVYGSIGGMIVLLIWLFISAIIIIMGGELNAVLSFIKEGREKQQGKRF